jgi:hypothetical protein
MMVTYISTGRSDGNLRNADAKIKRRSEKGEYSPGGGDFLNFPISPENGIKFPTNCC